ncbi:hypothetical protein ACOQFL_16155 [Actinopolyspora sp. H202]
MYGSYRKRVLEYRGERWLDEPSTPEIKQLAERVPARLTDWSAPSEP